MLGEDNRCGEGDGWRMIGEAAWGVDGNISGFE